VFFVEAYGFLLLELTDNNALSLSLLYSAMSFIAIYFSFHPRDYSLYTRMLVETEVYKYCDVDVYLRHFCTKLNI
jgi:hypothetical protein